MFSKQCTPVKSNGPVATTEVDALAEKLYNQLSLQLKKKETSKVQTNLQAPTNLKFCVDVRCGFQCSFMFFLIHSNCLRT